MSIKEIREREEKATKGPWGIPRANVHRVIALKDDKPYLLIVEHPDERAYFGQDDISYFRLGPEKGGKQSHADREFIAAARTDIPDLLDLLDRAKECIKASAHALKSYQYGNSSPDLAEAIADKAESILRELEG